MHVPLPYPPELSAGSALASAILTFDLITHAKVNLNVNHLYHVLYSINLVSDG